MPFIKFGWTWWKWDDVYLRFRSGRYKQSLIFPSKHGHHWSRMKIGMQCNDYFPKFWEPSVFNYRYLHFWGILHLYLYRCVRHSQSFEQLEVKSSALIMSMGPYRTCIHFRIWFLEFPLEIHINQLSFDFIFIEFIGNGSILLNL